MLLQAAAAVIFTATAGSITPAGLYTAPANPSGVARVIVHAADKSDTSRVTFAAGGGGLAGIPFGLSRTPVSALGALFTYSLIPHQDSVLRDLPRIQAAGGRVSINLINSGTCTLDAAGVYRYELWEACHDRVAIPHRALIASYAAAGVITDNYLADEPNHPTRWGPNGISQADVERMAAHSKSLWPDLPTAVRAAPDWLERGGIRYQYLDIAWAQYRASRGPIEEYVRHHSEAARRLGLCLAVALNVLDGGTTDPTSPLFSGWRNSTARNGSPLYSMSPAELMRYGRVVVAARPFVISGYRYLPAYLARPGVRDSLTALATLAGRQPQGDCTG